MLNLVDQFKENKNQFMAGNAVKAFPKEINIPSIYPDFEYRLVCRSKKKKAEGS